MSRRQQRQRRQGGRWLVPLSTAYLRTTLPTFSAGSRSKVLAARRRERAKARSTLPSAIPWPPQVLGGYLDIQLCIQEVSWGAGASG